VYDAFSANLLAPDHVHPSEAGHRLIARLLVRLGFAPY
jgi:lysophospholipase L1-like esterase